MADRPEVSREKTNNSAKVPSGNKLKNTSGRRGQGAKVKQPAEQDASKIVAKAYEEAARIIDEAKLKAEHIVAEAGQLHTVTYKQLGDLLKSHDVTIASYEQIDDLFVQIKRYLGGINENDQTKANELKDMVNQLEYWVESLVIDSLKLRSMQNWLQGTTELARKLRAQLDIE
jgi:cell division septum initiation protein DivIVA